MMYDDVEISDALARFTDRDLYARLELAEKAREEAAHDGRDGDLRDAERMRRETLAELDRRRRVRNDRDERDRERGEFLSELEYRAVEDEESTV